MATAEAWQHREAQVQQLRLLLSKHHVPDILVHGPPASGKTSIVR